jgi:hypothetical protein
LATIGIAIVSGILHVPSMGCDGLTYHSAAG